jgi:hypothetical protein
VSSAPLRVHFTWSSLNGADSTQLLLAAVPLGQTQLVYDALREECPGLSFCGWASAQGMWERITIAPHPPLATVQELRKFLSRKAWSDVVVVLNGVDLRKDRAYLQEVDDQCTDMARITPRKCYTICAVGPEACLTHLAPPVEELVSITSDRRPIGLRTHSSMAHVDVPAFALPEGGHPELEVALNSIREYATSYHRSQTTFRRDWKDVLLGALAKRFEVERVPLRECTTDTGVLFFPAHESYQHKRSIDLHPNRGEHNRALLAERSSAAALGRKVAANNCSNCVLRHKYSCHYQALHHCRGPVSREQVAAFVTKKVIEIYGKVPHRRAAWVRHHFALLEREVRWRPDGSKGRGISAYVAGVYPDYKSAKGYRGIYGPLPTLQGRPPFPGSYVRLRWGRISCGDSPAAATPLELGNGDLICSVPSMQRQQARLRGLMASDYSRQRASTQLNTKERWECYWLLAGLGLLGHGGWGRVEMVHDVSLWNTRGGVPQLRSGFSVSYEGLGDKILRLDLHELF